ncbi:HlyD family secretion protein, partial [Pseudochelatococcus lubricantis]
MVKSTNGWVFPVIGAVALAGGYFAWKTYENPGLPAGIVGGNGRIEAVEIDISTKIAGRIREILAQEGDLVSAGQVLARMDTAQLEAQQRQAQASSQRAVISVDTAKSLVTQREAERAATDAVVAQREAERDAAERKLVRSEQLIRTNATSQQTLDNDRAAAEGARAAVEAAKAAIESIAADIADSTLRSPRDGRVQYRVAQPGEVLSAGGRVLNLVDLSDVYMTFFLPTAEAGRVAIGTDVRLVLDAAPQYVIPARASF